MRGDPMCRVVMSLDQWAVALTAVERAAQDCARWVIGFGDNEDAYRSADRMRGLLDAARVIGSAYRMDDSS